MNKDKTVLIIDDSPDNIRLISDLLKDSYRIKVATDGEKGLSIIFSKNPPDLVLLDIIMPQMDGYEVCRRIKADRSSSSIPVIFLTSRTRHEDERMGLELGAVDYIMTPASPPILRARVATHLKLKEANDFLKEQNVILESKIEERTHEMSSLQDAVMVALGSLAETRDNETGNHIRRTQWYVRTIATELSQRYPGYMGLTPADITLLYKTAPLHDVGKVGVADSILLKPDKLTPDEFEEMKKHTIYGMDTILAAEEYLEKPNMIFRYAREMAFSHHERWDGLGYPMGLEGERIPLSARIMAIADVYDALVSRRIYKDAVCHEEAVAYIRENSGTQFDPVIVGSFLGIEEELRRIHIKYIDR